MKQVKSIMILMAIAIVFAALPGNTLATEKAPQAVVPEQEFKFGKIIEGNDVLHDFVIENKGTEVLKVEKVHTT